MPYQLFTQANFTKGELSPYMYARTDIAVYYAGLKQAQNVLNYPTGAAGKRFGTLYQSTLNPAITSFNQIFFQTFQYFDQCVYQLVFYPLNIDIYLEGIFIANVTTTLDAQSVYNLTSTILDGAFRVTGQGLKPFDLTRGANSPFTITGVSNNQFTIGSAGFAPNVVVPVQFSNSLGALPTTNPQIKAGLTYFIFTNSSSSASVYSTASDAKFQTNAYTLSNAGTGTNSIIIQNAWDFSATAFKNVPVFDFNGSTTSYDALTFTPSATAGNAVTITVSGAGYAPLNSSYVGGAFFGNGGTARITAVASATSFTVATQIPFASTGAILGSLAVLAEPAWSDARGWPQKCSSYQNRALFANSASLPNGFWASVVNSYDDFSDLTNDDDDGISFYPSSNDVNVIRFIVPFRSITVHTNSGIYSSPLSEISAITPNTFTLQLQDSTPADVLQPQAIDNQIFVLSGNDLHTMQWDGINNAYTSNIVSIANEQTIREPVDETNFADLRRAGSRYIFITNAEGSLAVYQTLQGEGISGLTPQIMEQSYGTAKFLQSASSFDGRCWFVIQRQLANYQSPIAISGFTSSTLTAVGIQSHSNAVGATPVTFTTNVTLPATNPANLIQQATVYWIIPLSANTFSVYFSQEDALTATNAIVFTSAGVGTSVNPGPLANYFTLEELSMDVRLDCAVYFNNGNSPMDTISTGILFNAQDIAMIGDGFGYTSPAEDNSGNKVTFTAHGSTVNVTEGYIGFPINMIIETMPLAPPPGQQTSLMKPKHIRSIRAMFNNTIGGTINGVPIALNPFNMAEIGEPPIPAKGFIEIGTLSGWDDFNYPSLIIEHSDPFNIELIGVQFSVDT